MPQKPTSPETAAIPIDKTVYYDRGQEHTIDAMTNAYLADVTLPLTVEPFASERKQRYKKVLKRDRVGNDEDVDEVAAEFVESDLSELRDTPSMIGFRGEAQQLEERRRNVAAKGYGTGDAYFARKSAELQARMHRFAQEYISNPYGSFKLETFHDTTEKDVAYIRRKAHQGQRISRERKISRKEPPGYNSPVHVYLPETLYNGRSEGWDRDMLTFTYDDKGQLTGLNIDELFSDSRFAANLERLGQSYAHGKELTASEVQLLVDSGVLDQSHAAPKDKDDVMRLNLPDNIDPEHFIVSPFTLLPFALRPELIDRLQDHTHNHFHHTRQLEVGQLKLNYRYHDYGESQTNIVMDVQHLTDDEINEVIATYIDVLKHFPRVSRVKKPDVNLD